MIVACMYCGHRKSEHSASLVAMTGGFRCKSGQMCQRRVRVGTPRQRGVDLGKCR